MSGSRATTGPRVLRVTPAPASRLPGDVPRDLDLATVTSTVEPWGPGRAVVHAADGRDVWALVGDDRPATPANARTVEVVVDGWRFELEVEDASRADLRERATRVRPAGSRSGPLEVRAMIPGRVAAVTVAVGDTVASGDTLLVVEAMKMQNELRAPRGGRVERVSIGVGDTIDLGDLLVTLA
jgi:biotin carboxyl carrier protein